MVVCDWEGNPLVEEVRAEEEEEEEEVKIADASSNNGSIAIDKEKMKMFLFEQCVDNKYHWFAFDAFYTDYARESFRLEEFGQMEQLPSELHNLYGCACAASVSEIYIVGGRKKNMDANSDEMFAFNFKFSSWSKDYPRMKSARCFLRAVAVNNKLYVFGNGKIIDREHWCEVYDFQGREWKYLDSHPPKRLTEVISPLSDAVYERGNQILLWSAETAELYSYNYLSGNWLIYNISFPISSEPPADTTFTVVGDFMFWHFRRNICAFDIVNHRCHGLVVIDDWRLRGIGSPSPSFLVHIGNGKLCLVLREPYDDGKISCYKFQIQLSNSSRMQTDNIWGDAAEEEPPLSLDFDGFYTFRTEASYIQAVFPLEVTIKSGQAWRRNEPAEIPIIG